MRASWAPTEKGLKGYSPSAPPPTRAVLILSTFYI